MSDKRVGICPVDGTLVSRGDICDTCADMGRDQPTHWHDSPCPAWADGQHCYTDVTTNVWGSLYREQNKRCACGKTVERKP